MKRNKTLVITTAIVAVAAGAAYLLRSGKGQELAKKWTGQGSGPSAEMHEYLHDENWLSENNPGQAERELSPGNMRP